MADKEKLLGFLLEARTKTYAGGGGKVAPVLAGTEKILKNEKQIYQLFYAGGLIGIPRLNTCEFAECPAQHIGGG